MDFITVAKLSLVAKSWRSTTTASSWVLFSLLLLCAHSVSHAHYNQPQYGVPQQQQQVYHQQGQPVQYQQQVPVQQQQQVYQQQPQQGGHPQQVVYQQQAGQHIPHYQEAPQAGQNVLHDASRIHDKEHIKEHLHESGSLGDQDVNKLSEEELQFHYFKMHDNDNNNMLDGSELIKSLIHWHVEESKQLGQNAPPQGTTKVFTDGELEQMIDPILQMDDKNNDGFIDYGEFISAQKTRGF